MEHAAESFMLHVSGLGVNSEVLVLPVFEHPVAGGHSDQQAGENEAALAQEPQTPADDVPSAPQPVGEGEALSHVSQSPVADIPAGGRRWKK